MINTEKETFIYNSTKKILTQIRRAFLFISLSAFGFYISTVKPIDYRMLIQVITSLMIVLFSLVLIFEIWKLKNNSPGLILNSKGLLDNNPNKSAGIVPWNEISNISVTNIRSAHLINIDVDNHHTFLSQGNLLTCFRNWSNKLYFGSPIILTSNTLDVEFDKLVNIIEKYHAKNNNA